MPITKIDIVSNNLTYQQETFDINQIDVDNLIVYILPVTRAENQPLTLQGSISLSTEATSFIRVSAP